MKATSLRHIFLCAPLASTAEQESITRIGCLLFEMYWEIFLLKIFHMTIIYVELITLLYLPYFHSHANSASTENWLRIHHGDKRTCMCLF